MKSKVRLGELSPKSGSPCQVVMLGFDEGELDSRGAVELTSGLKRRMMEMGFLVGSVVEVVQVAPISHDPIAVRVRGGLVALRRAEANLIWVQPIEEGKLS